MYFLPKEELESCPVAGRLANNVKLMRQVDLPLRPAQWEHFLKCGEDLVFYKIDSMTGEISSRKFDHNGLVQEFKGDKLPRDVNLKQDALYFDSLPIIGTHYTINSLTGFKKIKFSFYTIPGIIPDKIKMKDALVDVGYILDLSTVCVSSNYVAVISNIWQEDPPRSWTSRLTPQNEMQSQPRYQKFIILLKVERRNDNFYDFVEVSRHNLKRSFPVSFFKRETIISLKTEDTILFTTQQFEHSPSYLLLSIYNLKSKSIEQSIEIMEGPGESQVFFQDHVDYEGGVIVTVSLSTNRIRLFSKIVKKGYSLLKCFSMEFTYSITTRAFCCSNRYNQILFFLVNRGEVVVFDLFDTANFTVIPRGMKLYLEPDFYFNETGEEIYAHYDGERVLIYLYKSMFKSLLLQSALVVAKNYTIAQLRDMNLPRQLYKYVNTFSLFSMEANNLK